MSLILSDMGAVRILQKYFKGEVAISGNDYTLGLFVNNITPNDLYEVSNFTEPLDGGYAPKTLLADNFSISTVSGIAQATYPQQTFTFTGVLTTNSTIYGYFIYDADGILIYSERASTSFTPMNNGDKLLITPIFKLSTGTPV